MPADATERDFILATDGWLERTGPEADVVASSRVRLARNLPDTTFPMRAHEDDLRHVADQIAKALTHCAATQEFRRIDLDRIGPEGRTFLRENHLISVEFEKGGAHRFLAADPDLRAGIMVNEEDHIRLYCMGTGLCLDETLQRARAIDEGLAALLPPAFSDEFGFLTACPTNTGTGIRASVMLHLPALRMTQRIQEITEYIPDYGLTVRGFYGENSDFIGDYFQVSNEQTLGKSEDQIVGDLKKVVEEIAEKERTARQQLFEQKEAVAEDVIWRSFALLTNARVMNSAEAAKLLAKLRLGVDRGYFPHLSHEALGRLFVQIQPGHLQYRLGADGDGEQRDLIRAQLLRSALTPGNGKR